MKRPLKTLIFVAVMLALVALAMLLFPGFAHAGTVPPKSYLESLDEIPSAFRGAWCETKREHVLVRCRKPLDEMDIKITATALELGDTLCRRDKILVSRNRKYLSLRARCGTEANPDDWMGGFQMWLIGSDRLEYRE